jgi:glycosyltransferase involved in cell wall biosynthesis
MRQEADPGVWDLLGARIHNVGTARGSTRRLLAHFGAIHRDGAKRFGVAHAFFGWPAAATALIGWRYRVPVVFHASGGEFVDMPDFDYGMRTTVRGRLGLRLALAGARRVTVASRYMQRLARDHGTRAECVPLGIALDRWPARTPRARDVARPVRLLHVGDLRAVKDQYLLMAAVDHLRDAGVSFTLDVAGLDTLNGVTQTSPAARRVADVTRWHGVLRREALRELMDAADLLLVTSRHEAGPLVFLEAAIAGVPTVGTSVGHIADWAPEGAVAVPVGDAKALAREVAALAADEPRRLRIAHEAQRRATEIDAEFTAASFERIYREVAGTA